MNSFVLNCGMTVLGSTRVSSAVFFFSPLIWLEISVSNFKVCSKVIVHWAYCWQFCTVYFHYPKRHDQRNEGEA